MSIPANTNKNYALTHSHLLVFHRSGEHPLHISRRLVRDLLNGTEARVLFFVLIVRNPGADLDAIPAERERNIGQVNPENRFATGPSRPEMHHL